MFVIRELLQVRRMDGGNETGLAEEVDPLFPAQAQILGPCAAKGKQRAAAARTCHRGIGHTTGHDHLTRREPWERTGGTRGARFPGGRCCGFWRGRIRYLGITHYVTSAFDDLERVIKAEPLDFVQLNYSIATRDAEDRLLPLAAQREVAVLVNRPFERGALFRKVRGRPLPDWAAEMDCESWAQFFLKYVLSHPAVTCVIPATSKPEHLADNMQAGHGRLPDATQRRRMVDYFAGL